MRMRGLCKGVAMVAAVLMAAVSTAQQSSGKVKIHLNGWVKEVDTTGRTAGIKIDPGNMSPYTKTKVGAKTYTPPDSSRTGGIRGRLSRSPAKVLGVLAVYQQFPTVSALGGIDGGSAAKNQKNVNQDMRNPVYLADLSDDNSFSFKGLPPGKYDLMVICENCFYEGLLLAREESTLTPADLKTIQAKLKESNPFFDTKHQHRIAGAHGAYGKARILEQDVRTRPLTLQSAAYVTGVQIRSLKLCMMESVGNKRAGNHWELKKTRELLRQELGPLETKGVMPSFFRKELQGIRVSRRMKDIGTIALRQTREK